MDYFKKEEYWLRRRILDKIFQKVKSEINGFETKERELMSLNTKIKRRYERFCFDCVYKLRKDELVSRDKIENLFNIKQEGLLVDNEFEFDFPADSESLMVRLRYDKTFYGYYNEYSKCFYRSCENSCLFLFCREHSKKEEIFLIRDHYLERIPIKDKNLLDMVLLVEKQIKNSIISSIDRSIGLARLHLQNIAKPKDVIEIILPIATYYLDLVICEKIRI